MLRVHGSARSRALRTLWMVGELGIPYEHSDILPRSPATKTPEFLALNPNSRLPVIEDDGLVLYESMAINLYLAKKYRSPLYPTDPRGEALTLQWSFWEIDRLDRQIVNYANHAIVLPEAERDASIADAAWAEIVPAMDVLNGALAKARWLAGPEFSLADLNVAAALYRGLSMDLGRWPHVKDWLARCWDRPAAKRARAMREG
jgi:glutathione S-transferase